MPIGAVACKHAVLAAHDVALIPEEVPAALGAWPTTNHQCVARCCEIETTPNLTRQPASKRALDEGHVSAWCPQSIAPPFAVVHAHIHEAKSARSTLAKDATYVTVGAQDCRAGMLWRTQRSRERCSACMSVKEHASGAPVAPYSRALGVAVKGGACATGWR